MTAALRVYIAVSLDGFVATGDGEVRFLEPYQTLDYGYATFFGQVGIVVMGRRTYDQVAGFGEWPYGSARTLVLTSRALESPPPSVARAGGDVTRLAAALKTSGDKDVWIQGGARTIQSFLEADAIDRLDLFVMPVLLGTGIPLFDGEAGAAQTLALIASESYPTGAVRLSYRRKTA